MYRLAWVLVFCVSSLFGKGIEGFWKKVNDQTGKPHCIFAVYEYNGVYYGRIIATYDDKGVLKEDIYKPKERAPGVVGNPYYCGLDIIWGLESTGGDYKGKIMDPEAGKVYNASLWTDREGNLMVRGKLGFLFRTQTWFPVQDSDFPKGFKKPLLKDLIPAVPTVK